MDHARTKSSVAMAEPAASSEPAGVDLRETARIGLDVRTVFSLIGAVVVACGLYWHQDSRIERLESGLRRVETVNCAVASKMGLTLPDCGTRP